MKKYEIYRVSDRIKPLLKHEAKVGLASGGKALVITSGEIPCRMVFETSAFKGLLDAECETAAESCCRLFLQKLDARTRAVIKSIDVFGKDPEEVLKECEQIDRCRIGGRLIKGPDYRNDPAFKERMEALRDTGSMQAFTGHETAMDLSAEAEREM